MKYHIIVFLWAFGFNVFGQIERVLTDKYLESFKAIAENNEPTYMLGEDTLVVARLPQIPDSINNFIYSCIDKNLSSVDKYAFLMILRLKEEFLIKNKSDFDFCYYEGNAIIDLVRNRMNIEYDPIGCSFFKTYDVYLWVRKNESKFKDYPLLATQLEKIENLIKTRK